MKQYGVSSGLGRNSRGDLGLAIDFGGVCTAVEVSRKLAVRLMAFVTFTGQIMWGGERG